MDLAELGLKVDSAPVVAATSDLKNLSAASKEAQKSSIDWGESTTKATKATAQMAAEVQKAATARNIETQATQKYTAEFMKTMDGLKHEYDLIGKNATQRRTMNELRNAGVTATSAEGKAIAAAVEKIDKETAALEKATAMKKAATVAALAFAAAIGTGLVAGIGSAIGRLEEQRIALEKYNQAITQTGTKAALTGEQLKEFADNLEAQTGRAAEEILKVAPKLAAMKIDPTQFERAITLANDLAAAVGGDLTSSMSGLSKALANPERGLMMLTRQGIQFTDAQVEMIKGLAASGEMLKAQTMILDQIQAKYGGLAEAGFSPLQKALWGLDEAGEDFFETIVNGTGLINGIIVALNAMTAVVNAVTNSLGVLGPVLLSVGAGMAVAFGPQILSSVTSLIAMIGGPMVKAVLAVNAAFMANPLTAILGAITAITVATVGWENIVKGVVDLWGRLVQVIGTATDALGWTQGLAERGIEIRMNADEAVEKIRTVGGYVGDDFENSIDNGGDKAANDLKNGVAAGGQTAAQYLRSALDQQSADAVTRYEQINGKFGEMLVKSAQTGAEYLYNAYTGAVKETSPVIEEGIVTGGEQAADMMGNAVSKAGASISGSMSTAMSDILGGFQAFGGDLLTAMGQAQAAVHNSLRLMVVQADLIRAQTQEIYSRINSGGGGGGGSGGGSGDSGGSGFTGKTTKSRGGGGATLTSAGFTGLTSYASPVKLTNTAGDRVQGADGQAVQGWRMTNGVALGSVATNTPGLLSQQATIDGKPVNINIVNVTDPASVPASMATQTGSQTIINALRNNREEVLAILGV